MIFNDHSSEVTQRRKLTKIKAEHLLGEEKRYAQCLGEAVWVWSSTHRPVVSGVSLHTHTHFQSLLESQVYVEEIWPNTENPGLMS